MLANATQKMKSLAGRRAAKQFNKSLLDAASAPTPRYYAQFITQRRDIMAAQRLRHRVFSEAYNVKLPGVFGFDRDRYDRHCKHLAVFDQQSRKIVGYTRLLTQHGALKCGGFYSSNEFQLNGLYRLSGQVVELGRTCIHPDHRGGAIMTVLWGGLAKFMVQENVGHLIGCASVAVTDDLDVQGLSQRLLSKYSAHQGLSVMPKRNAPTRSLVAQGSTSIPPLLAAYLRMGAKVCGEPCWDPDFNCLDYFIVMSLPDMPERYVQHYMRPVSAAV